MTPKVYEQAIGFMRIIDGKNPLDRTSSESIISFNVYLSIPSFLLYSSISIFRELFSFSLPISLRN